MMRSWICALACLGILAGCGKKEEPSAAGKAITEHIQEPLDRARAIEQQQVQAAEDRGKKIDEATR